MARRIGLHPRLAPRSGAACACSRPAARICAVELISDLLAGEYTHPIRIVVFNTAEGWCRDATVEIADEMRRRYVEDDEAPASVLDFLEAVRPR